MYCCLTTTYGHWCLCWALLNADHLRQEQVDGSWCFSKWWFTIEVLSIWVETVYSFPFPHSLFFVLQTPSIDATTTDVACQDLYGFTKSGNWQIEHRLWFSIIHQMTWSSIQHECVMLHLQLVTCAWSSWPSKGLHSDYLWYERRGGWLQMTNSPRRGATAAKMSSWSFSGWWLTKFVKPAKLIESTHIWVSSTVAPAVALACHHIYIPFWTWFIFLHFTEDMASLASFLTGWQCLHSIDLFDSPANHSLMCWLHPQALVYSLMTPSPSPPSAPSLASLCVNIVPESEHENVSSESMPSKLIILVSSSLSKPKHAASSTIIQSSRSCKLNSTPASMIDLISSRHSESSSEWWSLVKSIPLCLHPPKSQTPQWCPTQR